MDRPRHCARPGCGGQATSTMTYHYASRTVWLDNLDLEPEPGDHDLCASHTTRLRPPVGWAVEDRRTPIIPLRPQIAV